MLYADIRGAEDAWPILRDFAYRTYREPLFENQVATLEIEGRSATITFEGAVLEEKEPGLKKLYRHRLA